MGRSSRSSQSRSKGTASFDKRSSYDNEFVDSNSPPSSDVDLVLDTQSVRPPRDAERYCVNIVCKKTSTKWSNFIGTKEQVNAFLGQWHMMQWFVVYRPNATIQRVNGFDVHDLYYYLELNVPGFNDAFLYNQDRSLVLNEKKEIQVEILCDGKEVIEEVVVPAPTEESILELALKREAKLSIWLPSSPPLD